MYDFQPFYFLNDNNDICYSDCNGDQVVFTKQMLVKRLNEQILNPYHKILLSNMRRDILLHIKRCKTSNDILEYLDSEYFNRLI